jgi:hypothetical protein
MGAEILRWRTGRKVGRTIYAQPGAEPSDEDLLIGVMDTPALAREAVEAHNEARLARLSAELPFAADLRAYMTATGWAEEGSGAAGSIFAKDGRRFGVPHDDSDPLMVDAAVTRLAAAEKRSLAQVIADIGGADRG